MPDPLRPSRIFDPLPRGGDKLHRKAPAADTTSSSSKVGMASPKRAASARSTGFERLWAGGGGGSLRVVVITRNFPNRVEPLACAFQRQQLAALARRASVEVLATIPCLPGAALLGDRTRPGRLRALPRRDTIDGVKVVHPRVAYVPGVSRAQALAPVHGALYLAGLLPHVAGLRGRFDVVLGTHLFPDAWAACLVARILGLPCVVKAHGTDVNVVAQWPAVRPLVARTLASARFTAGVSRPLVDALIHLGAPADRAVLLPNGVDRAVFCPAGRVEARRALGLAESARIVVYVGSLEPEKGLRELASALSILPNGEPVHVVLVGEGTLEEELRQRAALLAGSGRRMLLVGPQTLAGVARYLAASDVLTLPSWAEGTPNVVLEALAVGRPVVASRVGGIPDAIVEGVTGLLVEPHDPGALAVALADALRRRWDEAAIVASAPPSWEESAARLFDLLWEAAKGEHPRGHAAMTNGATANGAPARR
jgi:glycosyltransferase involved in cell wall biosynthesis